MSVKLTRKCNRCHQTFDKSLFVDKRVCIKCRTYRKCRDCSIDKIIGQKIKKSGSKLKVLLKSL